MSSGAADVVAFNGMAFRYFAHPIPIKVGEPVRVYVVNAGPNHFSAFHVIGTLFQNAYVDGNPANALHGVQTMTIAPGGGGMMEFTVYQAGRYPFVTHQFNDADHGAIGSSSRSKRPSGDAPMTALARDGGWMRPFGCGRCHRAFGRTSRAAG